MAEHLQDLHLSSDVPISPKLIKVLNTLSGQTMLRPAAAEISTAFMYKGWSKVTHGFVEHSVFLPEWLEMNENVE